MIRTGWWRTTGNVRNVAGTACRTRNLTTRASMRHSGKGRRNRPLCSGTPSATLTLTFNCTTRKPDCYNVVPKLHVSHQWLSISETGPPKSSPRPWPG